MISKYDILKLQDLPIEQVAEDLGLHVSRHKAVCPFHDDTRPSLTFNTCRNRYRCYVCNAKGGVIDLVMNTLGKNFIEACKWLGADTEDREKRVSVPRPKRAVEDVKPDVAYLERLMCQPVINEQAARFLFQERKISRKVVEQLGISSISYSCPMSSSPQPAYFDGPALLIPYRDIDGNLVSVQSRYLGNLASATKVGQEGPPRFRFPKGSRCSIFNLDGLKNLAPQEPVFITEGVTDCLAMLSAGFASIAIPSATLLKPEDVDLIRSSLIAHHSSVHMYPDADEPGTKLYGQLKVLLPQLVKHTLPEGFKDVGQYYAFLHKNDPIVKC